MWPKQDSTFVSISPWAENNVVVFLIRFEYEKVLSCGECVVLILSCQHETSICGVLVGTDFREPMIHKS